MKQAFLRAVKISQRACAVVSVAVSSMDIILLCLMAGMMLSRILLPGLDI